MAIIKLTGLSDVKEAVEAPEGAYYLQLVSIKENKKEGKKRTLLAAFSIKDEDREYANLFDYWSIPEEGDDADQINFKLLMIKRRLHWLEMNELIETGELDPTVLTGARTIIPIPVAVEPYKDEKTGESRMQRRIKWPQLPSEE